MDKFNFIIKKKFQELLKPSQNKNEEDKKREAKEKLENESVNSTEDSGDDSTTVVVSDDETINEAQSVRIQPGRNGNDLSFNIDLSLNGLHSEDNRSNLDSETSSIASDAEAENEKQLRKHRDVSVDVEFDISVNATPVHRHGHGRDNRSANGNGYSKDNKQRDSKSKDKQSKDSPSENNTNKLVSNNYEVVEEQNDKLIVDANFDDSHQAVNLDSVLEESDINTPRSDLVTPRSGLTTPREEVSSRINASRLKSNGDVGSGYDSGFVEVKQETANASTVESVRDTQEVRECLDRMERNDRRSGRRYVQRSSSLRENRPENPSQINRRTRTSSLERSNRVSPPREQGGAKPKVKSEVWRSREERRTKRRRSLAEADRPRPKLERSNSWVGKSRTESRLLKDIEAKGKFEKENSDTILMLYKIKKFMKKSFPDLENCPVDQTLKDQQTKDKEEVNEFEAEEEIMQEENCLVSAAPPNSTGNEEDTEDIIKSSPKEERRVSRDRKMPAINPPEINRQFSSSDPVEEDETTNPAFISIPSSLASDTIPSSSTLSSVDHNIPTVSHQQKEEDKFSYEDVVLRKKKTPPPVPPKQRIKSNNEDVFYDSDNSSQKSPISPMQRQGLSSNKPLNSKKPHKMSKVELVYMDDPEFAHKHHESLGIELGEGEEIHSKVVVIMEEDDNEGNVTQHMVPIDDEEDVEEEKMNSNEKQKSDNEIKEIAKESGFTVTSKETVRKAIGSDILNPEKGETVTIETSANIPKIKEPIIPPRSPARVNLRKSLAADFFSAARKNTFSDSDEPSMIRTYSTTEEHEPEAEIHATKVQLVRTEARDLNRLKPGEMSIKPDEDETLHSMEVVVVTNVDDSGNSSQSLIPLHSESDLEIQDDMDDMVRNRNFYSPINRKYSSSQQMAPLSLSARGIPGARLSVVDAPSSPILQTEAYRKYSTASKGSHSPFGFDDRPINKQFSNIIESLERIGQNKQGGKLGCMGEMRARSKTYDSDDSSDRSGVFVFPRQHSDSSVDSRSSNSKFSERFLSEISRQGLDKSHSMSSDYKREIDQLKAKEQRINDLKEQLVRKKHTKRTQSDESEASEFSELSDFSDVDPYVKHDIERLNQEPKVADMKSRLQSKANESRSASPFQKEAFEFRNLTQFKEGSDKQKKHQFRKGTNYRHTFDTDSDTLSVGSDMSSSVSDQPLSPLRLRSDVNNKISTWESRNSGEVSQMEHAFGSIGDGLASTSRRKFKRSYTFDGVDYQFKTRHTAENTDDDTLSTISTTSTENLSLTPRRKISETSTENGNLTPRRKISDASTGSNEDRVRKKSDWAMKLSQEVISTSPLPRENTNSPFRLYKTNSNRSSNVTSPASSVSDEPFSTNSLTRKSKFSELAFEPIKREQKLSFQAAINSEYGAGSNKKDNKDSITKPKLTKQNSLEAQDQQKERKSSEPFKSRLASQSRVESPKISEAFEAVKSTIINSESPELFTPTLNSKIRHEKTNGNKDVLSNGHDERTHHFSFSESPDKENKADNAFHTWQDPDNGNLDNEKNERKRTLTTASTDSGYTELLSPRMLSPVPDVFVDDTDFKDSEGTVRPGSSENKQCKSYELRVPQEHPCGYVSDSFVPHLDSSDSEEDSKSLPDESMGDAVAALMEEEDRHNPAAFNTLHHEAAVYAEFEKIVKSKRRKRKNSKPLINRDS